MRCSTSGIYQIVNTVNGKKYIGSAVNFRKRWRLHISCLRNGTHHSKHLQAAWNKYGEEAFTFEKIMECAKEELLDYEQLCLDEENPEYNMALCATNPMLGRKHSEEALHLMKGKIVSKETRVKLSVAGQKGLLFQKKHEQK